MLNNTHKNMLETLSRMMKPARKILSISLEELSELSRVPASVILNVEEGKSSFSPEHFLPLAAVLDNSKFTEDENIYRAVLRLMTPENEAYSFYDDEDFVLVRRWLDAFNEIPSDFDDDYSYGDYDKIMTDTELEAIARECRIFADTSAVEDENFPALLSRLEPFLKEAGSKVIVPYSVMDELRGIVEDTEYEDEEFSASDAISRVERFQRDGLIEVQGSEDDGTVEDSFGEIFSQDDGSKFVLITQDNGLAWTFEDNSSVKSARITDTGDLALWKDN